MVFLQHVGRNEKYEVLHSLYKLRSKKPGWVSSLELDSCVSLWPLVWQVYKASSVYKMGLSPKESVWETHVRYIGDMLTGLAECPPLLHRSMKYHWLFLSHFLHYPSLFPECNTHLLFVSLTQNVGTFILSVWLSPKICWCCWKQDGPQKCFQLRYQTKMNKWRVQFGCHRVQRLQHGVTTFSKTVVCLWNAFPGHFLIQDKLSGSNRGL